MTWHPFEAPLDQISSILDVLQGVRTASDLGHQDLKVHFSKVLVALKELYHRLLADLLQLLHLRIRWHAFYLGLLKDLETLCVAREERRPRYQFEKNAPNRPYVDADVVLV